MYASTRAAWIGLLAVTCATPFACTFLSDFPDVETDQPTTTSTGGAGGSGATSSDASSGSTASSACPTFCTGQACAMDDVSTRIGFSTMTATRGVRPRGLAAVGGDTFVSLSHQSPIDVTTSELIQPGPQEGSDLVYRVGATRGLVARTYECHVSLGGFDIGRLTASSDRLLMNVTSASSTESASDVQLDRMPAGSECDGVRGYATGAGERVPFLVSFSPISAAGKDVIPALGNAPGSPVRAAYLATAAQGTKVAVLGVMPATEMIYGVQGNCDNGAAACHFVLVYDFAIPTAPTIAVDMVEAWGQGGVYPGVDAPAAITFDEAGGIWATSTESHGQSSDQTPQPRDQQIVVFHQTSGLPGIVRRTITQNRTARASAIVASGGRIYVAGDAEGTITFGGASRPGVATRRDLFVMAFDAATFAAQSEPLWIRPTDSSDAGFDMTVPSSANDMVISTPVDCAPSLYVAGCVATDAAGGCEEGESSNALLFRIDPTGTILRTTVMPPTMGALRGVDLEIDPGGDGIWMSFGLQGEAFGIQSAALDRPATIVTRLPL